MNAVHLMFVLPLAALTVSACSGAPARQDRVLQPAGFVDRGTGVDLHLSEDGTVAERTLAISPDTVWRLLPEAYDSLGLGGGVLDARTRSWGNPRVAARTVAGSRTDSFFRCANQGTGASRVGRFRVEFSVATTVSETEDGRALLNTAIVATGTPWEGTSTSRMVCISNGLLERAIEGRLVALATGR
ncbi:MAG TPA: hypothetical protein VE173_07575 [Longimicrobiales bacterium]|nr:hypothetical protein [Longimicrobiales bacterium]